MVGILISNSVPARLVCDDCGGKALTVKEKLELEPKWKELINDRNKEGGE